MPYLIDGHNLIQALPNISLDDPHDEAKLVAVLRGFMIGHGKKCTVIFDRGLPGGTSKLSCSRVKVVFASTGQEADSRIINQIRNLPNPSSWTLVSSDRHIRAVAKQQKMKLFHSREFAQLLELQKRDSEKKERCNSSISDSELQDWLQIFGDDH